MKRLLILSSLPEASIEPNSETGRAQDDTTSALNPYCTVQYSARRLGDIQAELTNTNPDRTQRSETGVAKAQSDLTTLPNSPDRQSERHLRSLSLLLPPLYSVDRVTSCQAR